MEKKLSILVLILIFAFCTNRAVSQTTSVILLSQGNGQDSYLAYGAPSTNYGNHPSMGGNTWTCNSVLCLSRGLFQFDMSSIPPNAIIVSASLQLFGDLNWSNSPTTGGPNNSGFLSRVIAPWVESAVTWNSQPAITTVNQLTIPGSTSTAQNYTLNVTSLIQDIHANTNYGFLLQMQDELNYYKSLMFASSDNADISKIPVLTIVYKATITGIEEIETKAIANVYPNPFQETLTIECSKEMKHVVLRDLFGKTVAEESVSGKTHNLNIKAQSGVFILSVYGENNQLLSTKKITSFN